MTAEQRAQIQATVRRTPKTIWGYWPFLLPVIVVVAGMAVQITLLIYFKSKAPDLEFLVKYGSKIEPLWDSQLIHEAVLVASFSITVTFMMFILLARLAFKNEVLLKAAAKDAGIDPG